MRMHPATPAADRVICEAAQRLNEYMIALADLRRDLAAMRLPIPAAEDRLDHIDDLLAVVKSQLNAASVIMDDAADGVRREDDARYDNAANDDELVEDAA